MRSNKNKMTTTTATNVVYLLECTVCGVQYVGRTCTPFRLRFNNHKACSRKFNSGASVPQVESFRHFIEEGHHEFLKDISVKIIDRLTGGNRMWESFWQYRLDCFAPEGLNTRQVDTQISLFFAFWLLCCFNFGAELFVRDTRCFFRVFCSASPLSDLSIVCFVVTCDLF